MQAESIEPDSSERGWFRRLRYPTSCVQTFRPCDWSDFSTYICEGERFSAVMRERTEWLNTQNISHNIHYLSVEDVEETKPRVYRLFVEFTNTADFLIYRLHWDNGTASRI